MFLNLLLKVVGPEPMEPKQYFMLGLLIAVAVIGSAIVVHTLMKLDEDEEDTDNPFPHGREDE